MATSYDTACQQGAQCDRQTMAVFDRSERNIVPYTSWFLHELPQDTVVWTNTECAQRDARNIRDSDYTDDKTYAFMSQHGGPGAWILNFIPYIFSHIPVKKHILMALESR